ncbi:MAG: PDZ domain-containing protein, partial [Spirochaetota bacterium]|nr:PDZ domain-containing protein [Spirochaetota bacterium]
ISETPQEVAKHLDVDKKAGIFVQDVESGSPADKAGIKPGDLILKVENHDIHSVSQLQRVISSYKKGQKITTQILRNKEKINLTVVLGEMSTTKITKKGKSYVGPSKEFLGLVIGSVGDNYQQFKLDKNIKGVVVIELEENSPAESSGIKVGDIIQTINYVDISSMKDFEKFVSANKGKKGSYLVKIKRRGRNQFLVIENK